MASPQRRRTFWAGTGTIPAAVRRTVRGLAFAASLSAGSVATASADQPVPMPRPRPPVAEAVTTQAGLGAWVADRVDELEAVLARSGLDVDALVARFDEGGERLSEGQGGPLVPSLGAPPASRPPAPGDEAERLQRVRKLLAIMPLAAPMRTYKLTSGFGYRRDPFSRRGALHTGQDFGGPRNAPVLATAPGRVIEAKRAGAYGIMVEIDHGMGIRTRYAHLRKTLVRRGQRVKVRQKIGIMGSTGRSTGPHLHYEIRVDGRPLDPAKFLEAGGELRQLVGGGR